MVIPPPVTNPRAFAMNLTLTSGDRAQLFHAQETLLSLLEYETVDRWRSDVNDQIKQLVGADKALFMLPGVEGPRVYSEEFELSKVNEYPAQLHPLDARYSIWEAVVKLGVADREMFWGDWLNQYYRSPYYNEYVVPIRGFHGVSMAVALDDARSKNAGVYNEDTVAQIVVHHDTPKQSPFGERGVAMLRLLYPAFLSGVRTAQQLNVRRSVLLRTCDASDTPILVVDRLGKAIHRTPALTALLNADPESETVESAIQRVARRFVRGNGGADTPDAPPVAVVKTAHSCYRVYGVRSTRDLAEVGAAALILVKPSRAPITTLKGLQDRFDLTPRQAEVAQLLARRKTNPEIADALCISPHTARHHTEAVLQKLDISSRRDVHPRLLGR